MREDTMSRQMGFLALALLIATGGIVGCGRKGNAPAGPQATAIAEKPGTQVQLTEAKTEAISETIEVTGALNAQEDVSVNVKLPGKLVAVYAREGDRVTANQVVAQQDTTDLQSQVDQARANLLSAQTRLSQAQIAAKNALTTLKWTDDQTRSATKLAEAGLKVAQEQAAIIKSGARPQERQQSEENLAAAKADRDRARSDLKRYQELYRQQAISAQQLDQAQAVSDAADARYNVAAQGLSLVQEGARQEDIRRAQAAIDQARQQLATAQSNRDQVNLRRADVDTAQANVTAARAGVQQAQAALRLTEQAIRDAAVRSPITGVVAERRAEPGVQMAAGRDVLRIVALNSIYFDAQLPETWYERVQLGMPVTVRVDALTGKTFQGKVSKLFPVASAAGRNFTVRISLNNQGELLRPQMFARGEIVLDVHENVVVIPRDAVLDFDGKSGRVFVAKDGKADERQVKIGFVTFQKVEIRSGVQAGEQVVTVGQSQISRGDKLLTQVSAPAPIQQASNTPE